MHARKQPWPQTIGVVILLLSALGFGVLKYRAATRAQRPGGAATQGNTFSVSVDSLARFLKSDSARSAVKPDSEDGLPGPFYRGIALGLFSRDPAFEYGGLMDEISDHKADWISLVFELEQETATSSQLTLSRRTAGSLETIASRIQEARSKGFRVLVFPILILSNPRRGEWRGALNPDDLEGWFLQYRQIIMDLASVAEKEGAEAFSMGSEFSSLEHHTENWVGLARHVRERFSGEVIYSANWDHYHNIGFWEELDAVGLSGYYELSQSRQPELSDLVQAWDIHRDQILDWRRKKKLSKRIIFTEIGYANQDGTSVHPWDYTRRASPDPAEQAICYEAFIRSWHGVEPLAGVFFYNWFGHASEEDTGYSPRGKPAAELIRLWYGHLDPTQAR